MKAMESSSHAIFIGGIQGQMNHPVID